MISSVRGIPKTTGLSPIVEKLADYKIPSNILHIFSIARYFFMTDKVINSNIVKLATYPISQTFVKCKDSKIQKKIENVLNKIDIREFMINMGIPFYKYGNSINGFLEPFERKLKCPNPKCNHLQDIDDEKKGWKLQTGKFYIKCQKCKKESLAIVEDKVVKNTTPKLISWSIFEVIPDYNKYSGNTTYYKYITDEEQMKVKKQNVDFLRSCPIQILDLYRQKNRIIILNPDNQFHFKNFTLPDTWPSYGFPSLLPLFITLNYIGILKKANEALAKDFTVPLRFIVPVDAYATANAPGVSLDLKIWEAKVKYHIKKWREDPLHIGFLGLPAKVIHFSSEGRSLMLSDHIKLETNDLIAGQGMPVGFYRGDLNWTGQSITMRMLENQFLGHRRGMDRFLNYFLCPKLKSVYNISAETEILIYMDKFRMADDVQYKQAIVAGNAAGKVSDKTVLEQAFQLDYEAEQEQIKKELLDKLDLSRYQQELQRELQHSVEALTRTIDSEQTINMDATLDMWIKDLSKLSPERRIITLEWMKKKSPSSYQLLTARLKGIKEMEGQIKPLPEQKPPRREVKVI